MRELAWIDSIGKECWPKLCSVARIESEFETHGQLQIDTHYLPVRRAPAPSHASASIQSCRTLDEITVSILIQVQQGTEAARALATGSLTFLSINRLSL